MYHVVYREYKRMAGLKRKQICLEVNQDRRLRVLSRRQRVGESELIRRGIDRTLNEPLRSTLDHNAWLRELAFIDSLMRRGPIKGGRVEARGPLSEEIPFSLAATP
jgi:hypothetical protein